MAGNDLILIDNPFHKRRIAELAGVIVNMESDVSISRADADGRFLGGVLFNGFTGASIAIHVGAAAPRWLNRRLLWMIFDYPFNQLVVKKVIGQVEAVKVKVLEFDRKIGFKEEARIADVFPSGDMVVLGMYRQDCRWI